MWFQAGLRNCGFSKSGLLWKADSFITPSFLSFFFKFLFLLYFTLQYCIGFAIHWHESTMGVYAFPNMNPPSHLPPHNIPLGHPRAPAPSILYPASNRLAIRFLHDSIHVSMPFSQIIPPAPSPSESKSPLYTSVSLLLSRKQGNHYHLSKFHIYALVYCIGVFLSGLLHSVSVSSISLELIQKYSF